MSSSLNIILFGEAGTGKSSVINLIAGRPIADTSPDVMGCTMTFKPYTFPVNGRVLHIWDTVDIEEPEMGVDGYLSAIKQAQELINHLTSRGGVDLLLFCIRGNRVTTTTQSNYRLFYEVLCGSQVPIALVITHLEREAELENWWERNAESLEKFGIKVAGHACVTGFPMDNKYGESRRNIMRVLEGHDGTGRFNMPPDAWIVQSLRLFAPSRDGSKRKDIRNLLAKRCKLDPRISERLAVELEAHTSSPGYSPDTTQRRMPTEGDVSLTSAKQTPFKTISRSSTNVIEVKGAGLTGDHMAGYASSLGDSSPVTQSHSINVVLFGETGVGKSSVVNLIAQKDIARVSSDINGCTMQSTRYNIPFDGMNFAIFDTVGLEEPQMGINGYLKAIEQAYELIVKLTAARGIHLLLFCMRGSRITATTQSNYRLFSECLCSKRVPIALVFTGLETLVDMEEYWTESRADIERYGIRSDGHACITAVQDDTASGEDLKYVESQKRIRELLKNCALTSEVFSQEPHTWFAKLGRGMRYFIEKRKSPKGRDILKVLTNRCKLDLETARRIADMMQKDDTRAANTGGEGHSTLEVMADNQGEDNAATNDAPPKQLGNAKLEFRIPVEEKGGRTRVVQAGNTSGEGRSTSNSRVDQRKESAATDDSPPKQLGDTRPELHIPVEEKGGRTRVAQAQQEIRELVSREYP